MNRKQFRNSNSELPTKPGKYQWKVQSGMYAPVEYRDSKWYTVSGDLITMTVVKWR